MRALMEKIAEAEADVPSPNGDEADGIHHSFHPLTWQEGASRLPMTERERLDARNWNPGEKHRALESAKRFLPCHYFDFIGGTSTGA